MPTRLLMTCVGPGSDAGNSGENSGSCCCNTGVSGVSGVNGLSGSGGVSGSDGVSGSGGEGGSGGMGGEGGVGGGRMPVLRKPHSGLLQPARIDGNAGRLDAEVGSFSAMNGSTVLPWPPAAAPVAVELVIVPTGKLEPGIDPAGKLMNRALAPAKPPTALLVLPPAVPVAEEPSMLPKFAPTKPPMMSWLPVPLTDARAVELWIVPRFTPANPPR